MAKGITSKGRPRLGGGPISREGASVRSTTATPGRQRSKSARLSGTGPQKGTAKLRGGPITRGGGK